MIKILILLFLIVTYVKLIRTEDDAWKERNYDMLDYDDSDHLELNKCFNKESCKNSMEGKSLVLADLIKRRPTQDLAAFQDIEVKKSRTTPYYQSAHPIPCSCAMDFRLTDLGPQYYPRYLHTGVCKSESCGGPYQCIPKHYKVRVLKQRDSLNPDSIDITPMPDGLKKFWKSDSISVTVACECSL